MYVLIVFRLEWPWGVQDLVCTEDNPGRPVTQSDSGLTGLLLCWLVEEEISPCLRHTYMGVYWDNSTIVSWVTRMATRSSDVAGALFVALVLQLKE